MPKVMEAEARISAIDATGTKFEDIAKKVKGLSSAFKSLQGITSSGVGHINKTIGTLQKTMHTLAPVAATAAGAGGMHGMRGLIHETVKATTEQTHERVRAVLSGMSPQEVEAADKLSLELSQKYKAFDKGDVMHTLRNMRAIVGTYEEAAELLEPVMKLKMVTLAAHPERKEELEEDFDKLTKSQELVGATQDPKRFASNMNLIGKAMNAFGDTLKPYDFFEFAQHSRRAGQGYGDDFLLGVGPTLMQDMRGAAAGTAMSAFYRQFVGGHMTQAAAEMMKKYGLIDESKVEYTKAGLIKRLEPGAVKDSELAKTNPYQWIQKTFLPALAAHGVTSKEQIEDVGAVLASKDTTGQALGIFATQRSRIEKDLDSERKALGLDASIAEINKNDMGIAFQGVTEQFKNLLAIAGGPLAQPAVAGMHAIAEGIAALENAATGHPKAAAAGLLGGTTVGAGLAGWLTYKGLRGLTGLFGGGSAAEGAALAAAGPSVMGTVMAGGLRGGLYGGAFGALDAIKRDHDHSLRSQWRAIFGIPETEEDRLAPNSWERPSETSPAMGRKAFQPFNTWQPAAAYTAAVPTAAPEVKGSADLNVNVLVEPSDAFVSRIVQAVRNETNIFGRGYMPPPGSGIGTTGSTGLSMPEAGPNP